MQILVTGAARSGTSLTTQILGTLGAHLGECNRLFENSPIKHRVLKPMIASVGGDPLGQDPLPPRDADPRRAIRADVERYLGRHGWAFKDVKLALVWRAWDRAFPDAKWVIVRRPITNIAESCSNAPFMRGDRSLEEWRWWSEAYLKRIADLESTISEKRVIEIWPCKAIDGDLYQFERLAEFCGLDFDPLAVSRVIEPSLWHHR